MKRGLLLSLICLLGILPGCQDMTSPVPPFKVEITSESKLIEKLTAIGEEITVSVSIIGSPNHDRFPWWSWKSYAWIDGKSGHIMLAQLKKNLSPSGGSLTFDDIQLSKQKLERLKTSKVTLMINAHSSLLKDSKNLLHCDTVSMEIDAEVSTNKIPLAKVKCGLVGTSR